MFNILLVYWVLSNKSKLLKTNKIIKDELKLINKYKWHNIRKISRFLKLILACDIFILDEIIY